MKLRLTQKNIPILATMAVFILIYIIGGFMYKGFFSLRVFLNLLYDNSFLGIIAVGMTFVIISGGIDLSVGSVIAFSGMFVAKMMENEGWNPILVIITTLGICAFMGFCMGSLIHYFDLPAFLVTLVGMFLMRGLAFVISLESISIENAFFQKLSALYISFGRHGRFYLLAGVFLLIWGLGVYLSHFTKFGRNVYAIGGNEQSAVLMGLPVARTKILVYTLNSTLCGIAGIVYTLYTLSGYPRSGGMLELDVIAAVVIGGTLLTGGIGFVEGTLLGVMILGLIQTFITFQGTLSSWWSKIVIGVLICIFILLQKYLAVRPPELKKGDPAEFGWGQRIMKNWFGKAYK